MSDEADLKTPETGADSAPREAADTFGSPPRTDDGYGGDEPRESGASLLGQGSDDGVKVDAPATWPSDWRVKLSNGDEKLMKRLERFSDPSKIVNSWIAAEQKISSGEYKKGLDSNATEEQIAEWRKANGIPDDANGYKRPDIEGVEWAEDDAPMLDALFARLHEANASQTHVDAVLKTYADLVSQQNEARVEADRSWLQQNEDALRSRLGEEFRPQINVFQRVLNDPDGPLPRNVADKLINARYEDGNRVINDVDVAQFLIELGLNHWGEGSLVYGDAAVTAQSRIEEIKQVMKTDYDRYKREGMDKEYTKILERQMKNTRTGPSYFDP